MWRWPLLFVLLLAALLIGARPDDVDAPEAQVAATSTPAASTTPTPAPTPEATPSSTPTSAPPSPSPATTVDATATATPEDTATPEATPGAEPTPTDEPASVVDRYLAAAALLGDDPAAAAAAWLAIAEGTSFLAPFARIRAAEAFAAAEDQPAAAAAYSAAADDPDVPSSLRVDAHFAAADLLVELDDVDGALALLDGVLAESAARANSRAAMYWQRAELLRDRDDPAWVAAARNALVASPGTSAAADAADALIEAEAGAAALDLAYAYYRNRRNADSRAIYEDIAASDAPAEDIAFARFYLGALAERTAERTRALEQYAASLDAAPAGPLADDSRYWRGRVLEELGEHDLAVAEYDLLLEEYPGSAFVTDAATRAAVRVGLGGDPAAAATRFAALAASRSGASAATAARWRQLFAAQAGEGVPPGERATTFDPSSLAALLDASGSRWLSALPTSAADETPSAWTAAERATSEAETDAWLTARFGPAPPDSDDLDLLPLALELIAVDEHDFARLVLRRELDAQTNHHGRVAVARAASSLGIHDVALIAAIRVLGTLSPFERLDAPRELERLAYPIPFAGEVDAAIDDSDLPPLLLYALIRQESAFNPQAGSRAGALGLTQVIEPTGRAIASALGEPFDLDRLFEPATSLRYGAYYLTTQIENFDGNVLAALAGYNGGPGNAARWLDLMELPGGDGYIYAVEFTETRLYLERVIENYAWYRYLYLDLPTPALPWPPGEG